MSKSSDNAEPTGARNQPASASLTAKLAGAAVTKKEFLALAAVLGGRDTVQRMQKRDSQGEALRAAAEMYESREYVAAYESLKPAYDKVVSDMQRVLARNIEFEANKIAQAQRTPLATAKASVQRIRIHAQEVIDQFDRLLQDLQGKPLVRLHLKQAKPVATTKPIAAEPPPTTITSTAETLVDARSALPLEVSIAGRPYTRIDYAHPAVGTIYSVRDKAGRERFVRVLEIQPSGAAIQVEILENSGQPNRPIELAVESLARQAVKGWCSVLIPAHLEEPSPRGSAIDHSESTVTANMRLDIQNFGRCCSDIARANINFGTQLIKDVGDGPFRAGKFDQAFLKFEQLAVGFASAVANSRREIADGRRTLTSEKGKLSGKEIQDRTAAFIRHEQQITTAEREFSAILEGLRMFVRASE